MSTLGAMLLSIIVLGMLVAYYVGYAVGEREGYRKGRREGKQEGSVRAFAVGYDRGRHDRKAKESEESDKQGGWGLGNWRVIFWLGAIFILLVAIVTAASSASLEIGP